MEEDIKRQIKKLQAKRRRCDFLDDAIKLDKKIKELKTELKNI